MIGLEVGAALVKYINNGTSIGAVNFPEIDLRAIQVTDKSIRLLFCHYNVPGVLKVFYLKRISLINL
jgi:D-3-phosphoglycerate dehydrogenase